MGKIAWSKLIRRTHMYLALFLTPWMVVYALSSLIFNHHALFSGGKTLAQFEKVEALPYEAVFSDGIEPRVYMCWKLFATCKAGLATFLLLVFTI